MSHIVKCKVQLWQGTALDRAIEACELQDLGVKTHKLYAGNVHGRGVKLHGWNYPVVIDTDSGEAHYDNYGEAWGKQIELDKLVQQYSIGSIQEQAALSGMSVTESWQDNGDVELELEDFAVA